MSFGLLEQPVSTSPNSFYLDKYPSVFLLVFLTPFSSASPGQLLISGLGIISARKSIYPETLQEKLRPFSGISQQLQK